MKGALCLLFLSLCLSCFGQAITKVIVTVSEGCELCTKTPPEYKIIFKLSKSGAMAAHEYYKGKTKKRLGSDMIITRERIAEVQEWFSTRKKTFFLTDLDLQYDSLAAKLLDFSRKTDKCHLTAGIPKDVIIDTDSIDFCHRHSNKVEISSGTDAVNLEIIDDQKTRKFTLDSKLEKPLDYFIAFRILEEKIPDTFPLSGLFHKEQLYQSVLFYLKETECEEYYYKEFSAKHPERPAKDRRMKAGWNFEEYLKERANK
jgi:hypothetical protein